MYNRYTKEIENIRKGRAFMIHKAIVKKHNAIVKMLFTICLFPERKINYINKLYYIVYILYIYCIYYINCIVIK